MSAPVAPSSASGSGSGNELSEGSNGVVEFRLPNGFFTLIDETDLPAVAQFRWYSAQRKGQMARYVQRTACDNGQKRTVFLHRFILNAPAGVHVDHINCDPLDNRRANLRLCTAAQNLCNKNTIKKNSSLPKGVYKTTSTGRFGAYVNHGGRQIHLGTFDTPEEAARAYDKKARELHGEFARPNYPVSY